MGDTVVVEISGSVTIGHDAELREAIARALEAGARNILLDLHRVTRLDSSGVGELVAAHTTVRGRGGRLLVAELPPRAARVLQITQLIGVIELYDRVDDALAVLAAE